MQLRSIILRLRFAAFILAFVLAPTVGNAHELSVSHSHLNIVPDAEQLRLELTLNPFELTFISKIDEDGNGRISATELEMQQRALTEIVVGCVKLYVHGKQLSPEVTGISVNPGNDHLTFRADYRLDSRGARIGIESSLNAITGRSHVTDVAFGKSSRVQRARLDWQTTTAAFQATELPQAANSTRARNAASVRAILLVIALPGMLILACIFAFLHHKLHENDITHSH